MLASSCLNTGVQHRLVVSRVSPEHSPLVLLRVILQCVQLAPQESTSHMLAGLLLLTVCYAGLANTPQCPTYPLPVSAQPAMRVRICRR